MNNTLSILLKRLDDPVLKANNVIPWSSPIPSFGDISKARIATLGLNPSNREFVDVDGNELDGESRRFHTLKSLGLDRWADAEACHLQLIEDTCRAYFLRNPYDGWFKKLDYLISGTEASYYDDSMTACHLDLIPYATACKWTELTRQQRLTLLEIASDTLGLLLCQSQVRVIILNGRSVIEQFQEIAEVCLEKQTMVDWSLPRRVEPGVPGFSYRGIVRQIAGIELPRDILVLGFNHNIQSSFGVTTQVTTAIRYWITQTAKEAIA